MDLLNERSYVMKKNSVWRRMLIITSGLAFLVIPCLFWIMFLVKKDTSGIVAEEDIWVTHIGLFIVIQIFIVSALIRTSKGLLTAAGVISILSGLMYLYFALAFVFTIVHNLGVLFFISTGFNAVVGLFALTLRIKWQKGQSATLI